MTQKACPKSKKKKAPRDQHTQQRHTHSTIAALEDAISVLWGIIRVLKDALNYADNRIQRALEILKAARQGPHSYDPDQPSGKKITIKKR
jgi:hypothetical protein